MFDENKTYWANNGKHQKFVDEIEDKVPGWGYTSNVYVNIYLVMTHLYYDAYNNGGGNIEDNYAKEFDCRVRPYLEGEIYIRPFISENFPKMEQMMDAVLEYIKDKNLDFPIYSYWCNHDERVTSEVKPEGEWEEKGYWFPATFGEVETFKKEFRGYRDITGEFGVKEQGVKPRLDAVINECEEIAEEQLEKDSLVVSKAEIDEVREELHQALDGLIEYCETLEDSMVCSEHIEKALGSLEKISVRNRVDLEL